jgi:hypothetical protein
LLLPLLPEPILTSYFAVQATTKTEDIAKNRKLVEKKTTLWTLIETTAPKQ